MFCGKQGAGLFADTHTHISLQVLDILADLVPDQHGVQRALQGLLSSGTGPHRLLHCGRDCHLHSGLLWWNHAGKKYACSLMLSSAQC